MARRVLTSTSLPTKLFRQDQHPSQIYTQNFCISEVPPKKQKYIPKSGTYPNGFKVGSTNVGIKDNGEPDLVLVSSSELSNGAAVFTKNQFPAPSITVSKEALSRRGGRGLRGVIANSGCANLFTGQKGLEDARSMGRAAGETSEGEMMVMHTGGIRTKLPIDNITEAIPKLYKDSGNSHDHWLNAAYGICTSDTFPKLISRSFTLPCSPNREYSIAGITKGAGMIHPNMATTLGIMCTDAPVSPDALQHLLSTAVDGSYNCISVEGDTSTNDMVAMFANGAAGGDEVTLQPEHSDGFNSFQSILNDFMASMAQLVVRDAEGASKFITIRVRGSPDHGVAKQIAEAIARSVLFKTGIRDPTSWATAAVAVGYSMADIQFAGKKVVVPELTSVSLGPTDTRGYLRVLSRGLIEEVDDTQVEEILTQEDIEVVVDLRDIGDGSQFQGQDAVYWTCDLTHDFMTLNQP